MRTRGKDAGPLQLLSACCSADTIPWLTQKGKTNEPLLNHKSWVHGQAAGASWNHLDILEWQEKWKNLDKTKK